MSQVPQGAPHGTSICCEARDMADVGLEGRMVLGELWCLSLNTRCCLIPWGWDHPGPPARAAWGQQPPALCIGCEGTTWGSSLSLPPSRPVWPALGCGHRAAPCHQDPTGTPLLSLLPAFAPARSREGMASLPSGRDPVSGHRGPSCPLGSCSQQLPCAQPLPSCLCTVIF